MLERNATLTPPYRYIYTHTLHCAHTAIVITHTHSRAWYACVLVLYVCFRVRIQFRRSRGSVSFEDEAIGWTLCYSNETIRFCARMEEDDRKPLEGTELETATQDFVGSLIQSPNLMQQQPTNLHFTAHDSVPLLHEKNKRIYEQIVSIYNILPWKKQLWLILPWGHPQNLRVNGNGRQYFSTIHDCADRKQRLNLAGGKNTDWKLGKQWDNVLIFRLIAICCIIWIELSSECFLIVFLKLLLKKHLFELEAYCVLYATGFRVAFLIVKLFLFAKLF